MKCKLVITLPIAVSSFKDRKGGLNVELKSNGSVISASRATALSNRMKKATLPGTKNGKPVV
jgi:hypothetical protein